MLPLIKCCIRARLTTEKLKKLEPMSKFDIYMISTLISVGCVVNAIILSYYIWDGLRCLARIEISLSLLALSVLSCCYLEKNRFCEKTREYLDTLDEESFRKFRRHNTRVVWTALSICIISLVVVVGRFIMDGC